VAAVLEQQRISVWYSVPTALRLLREYGGLQRRDLSSLRLIFFAGEVFPVPSLRRLMEQLSHPRYVNLYGPTETNVCTYHILEVPPGEDEISIPIGIPCEHLAVTIRGEDGQPVASGQVGEICVTGPGVMQGYWQQQEVTKSVRFDGLDDSYRTGDFGYWSDSAIRLAGRRDQQIKIRGHRVELLEIESQLVTHPQVDQAAVVLLAPHSLQAELVAFVTPANGGKPTQASLLSHCCQRLPDYAVPARVVIRDELPTTSTGKVDRQRLMEWANELQSCQVTTPV
jgi:acyl-coenzyme A synthetase/AMP-(fatty) acid ligase